jgi:predicted permease
MSLWSRIANVFRTERLDSEIAEELEFHLAEAIEQGRDIDEARRALGVSHQLCRQKQASHDIRVLPWLDSLRVDAVFAWRQICRSKVTSAAAILSLALAMGACISAFRLIDAFLLRPLPVPASDRLYALAHREIDFDGTIENIDAWSYPAYQELQAAAKNDADLVAASYSERMDLTYGSDEDMEQANLQYVSGSLFNSFELQPVSGRLLDDWDEHQIGAHPYAVLSYNYWLHRFARDPGVIGHTFKMGGKPYEIVGVVDKRFTGTEPGTITDIFLPTMVSPGAQSSTSTWLRVLALLHPGTSAAALREKLNAVFLAVDREEQDASIRIPNQPRNLHTLLMEPAPTGVSDRQGENRRPLIILGSLVALLLLVACGNIANLKAAQTTARSREMALRISIGAGRWRLVRLMMVESTMLASVAALLGSIFAWWSAPVVVGMINPPDEPVRLTLDADWRVIAFGVGLTLFVTLLFGLAPALAVSGIKPVSALKGGHAPRTQHRLMRVSIAAQVAFCFIVLFVAGLFVISFKRLRDKPTGFVADRVITLETVSQPQSPIYWDQVAEHLRAVPGVQAAALVSWPLLDGSQRSRLISVHGAAPEGTPAYVLNVSPGWAEVMRIPLLDGRDFRPTDTYPGVAIVNQAFARRYFNGANPIGLSFDEVGTGGTRSRAQVVGLVGDTGFRNLREPMSPIAYFPYHIVDAKGTLQPIHRADFIVRTSSVNSLALATNLRREVHRARSEFLVHNIRSQQQIIEAQTIHERLLSTLATFFALVSLVLAGVGLYGVLDYLVSQMRREIGIRLAIGARLGDIAVRVTSDVFSMVLFGAITGLALGLACTRSIESLLFEVKPGDWLTLAPPSLAILATALLAAAPAVVRAVRIGPATILRSE